MDQKPYVILMLFEHLHRRDNISTSTPAQWPEHQQSHLSKANQRKNKTEGRSVWHNFNCVFSVYEYIIYVCIYIYTSIAARGGGGSFKRLKLYNSEEHVPIESFVTTLIHWTFFSDDANKVGICWLCRSGQLHVTPSSRWSLPRCHRSVRNDMRLFLRTKQYPIQLRTTKFWKVLPQYYSVLQSTTPESTTPVLLRTTKYYSSTTKY